MGGSSNNCFDHTVRLIDWKENIRIARVILVFETVGFQVERNIVDVWHIESDLKRKARHNNCNTDDRNLHHQWH